MRNYTDAILFIICEKLQLSPTLYEQAKERYETIAGIIQEDAAFTDCRFNRIGKERLYQYDYRQHLV